MLCVGREGMPYLHEPYSALTGLEHDVFVGIGHRVLVILATERVERLLLVVNGEVIHSETSEVSASRVLSHQPNRLDTRRICMQVVY